MLSTFVRRATAAALIVISSFFGVVLAKAQALVPSERLLAQGRLALNRGDYQAAATLFRKVERESPSQSVRAEATYWEAFALYKTGNATDLDSAIAALSRAPQSQPARMLAIRVRGLQALRGDSSAAQELERVSANESIACNQNWQVRSQALATLTRLDAPHAMRLMARILRSRGGCSEMLRRTAVLILGQTQRPESDDLLMLASQTDPAWRVRAAAVASLADVTNPRAAQVLTSLIASDADVPVRRAAVVALAHKTLSESGGPLHTIVSRGDLPAGIRVLALQRSRAGIFSVTELRALCDSATDLALRREAILVLEQRPDAGAAEQLKGIAEGGDPAIQGSARAALRRRQMQQRSNH
jgi:hypothetical protein